ncbi:MAG: saccharopine dehydrogenase NADP-binding domain-containing protein [Candidatus Thermoplasmatota archaeon]|nr:saccharopine dehydrogenase NADP-binding domain-containing protein [Candidatus Thermoplasmatota archaeon]
MKILVLGSGMMGRAIAYDLCKFSNFETITLADRNKEMIQSSRQFLNDTSIEYLNLDVDKKNDVDQTFKRFDFVISAVPYKFNYFLAKTAIDNNNHFLDLGGNNLIVEQELKLKKKAKENDVTVIPDCGLAPGLVSVIVKDIVEEFDYVNYVKLRVGGLPLNPAPPLYYEIVFSPYGLINEYVEDAIVLDHGNIVKKKSMTEIETIRFPDPFNEMEAFLTSGGCSTLPFTYKDKIGYLDYKTIRYPGHCEKFKLMLDMGFADEKPIDIQGQKVVPRDFLASILLQNLPIKGKDVVLLKVFGEGVKDSSPIKVEYTMIDYYDELHEITSMMRTTGYPISIIAQMIEKGQIRNRGVFCSEEVVPCKPFFEELSKRNIIIEKKKM